MNKTTIEMAMNISPLHVISLGAGVQSSTMALMAAAGEISPLPSVAIFADTQAEPQSVYTWLDWLETQLPFPVHRVTAGSLADSGVDMRVTADGRRYAKTSIPVFTVNEDGSKGMVTHRSCTLYFKIRPIRRRVKELAGIKRGERSVKVIQWIGISRDEAHRMKPSRDKWQENRWPLIEAGLTRNDCLEWMRRHGFPEPPRSSCVFCPYHSNAEWRRLKDEEAEAFRQAVEWEKRLQEAKENSDSFKSKPFLHRSCVPLDEVDLSTAEERGQGSLFGNECEGVCGV